MINFKVYKRCQPLFFYKERLVVFKKGSICYFDDDKFEFIFDFKLSSLNRLIHNFSFLHRLFRGGVYSAGCFEDSMFFSFRKKMFEYTNFNSPSEISTFKNNGPLNFAEVNKIAGFESGIYFGDYLDNPTKESVKLNKVTGSHKKEIKPVFSFKKGEANHIHNIIPDSINNCLWLLLGDFDNAAAIWKAKDNFSQLERVVSGSQKYRSCVAFPWKGGLLYATDSQLEKNSIRFLSLEDGCWESRKIFDLNGSSIYGMETKDYFVFSTSTEPDIIKNSRILAFLDNKNGPGILKKQSDIVICRKNDLKCKVIASLEKDCLPFRLFQFGSIKFPKGKVNNNVVYAYSIGSKENDLSMLVFDLDKHEFSI